MLKTYNAKSFTNMFLKEKLTLKYEAASYYIDHTIPLIQ